MELFPKVSSFVRNEVRKRGHCNAVGSVLPSAHHPAAMWVVCNTSPDVRSPGRHPELGRKAERWFQPQASWALFPGSQWLNLGIPMGLALFSLSYLPTSSAGASQP